MAGVRTGGPDPHLEDFNQTRQASDPRVARGNRSDRYGTIRGAGSALLLEPVVSGLVHVKEHETSNSLSLSAGQCTVIIDTLCMFVRSKKSNVLVFVGYHKHTTKLHLLDTPRMQGLICGFYGSDLFLALL